MAQIVSVIFVLLLNGSDSVRDIREKQSSEHIKCEWKMTNSHVVERVVEKIMHIRIQAWYRIQIFITMSYFKNSL